MKKDLARYEVARFHSLKKAVDAGVVAFWWKRDKLPVALIPLSYRFDGGRVSKTIRATASRRERAIEVGKGCIRPARLPVSKQEDHAHKVEPAGNRTSMSTGRPA